MVRLALGVSSFLFLFFGCHKSEESKIILKKYDTNKINLIDKSGKAFLQNKLFSGKLFTLNIKKDTVYKVAYELGLKEGEEIKYFESGKVQEIRHYKNGLQNGVAKGWYENGLPMFEYHFKNEAFHGIYNEWYANGKIYRNQNFIDGLELGIQQVYNIDGKIKINYVIKNGRRYGLLGTKNCKNVSEKLFR